MHISNALLKTAFFTPGLTKGSWGIPLLLEGSPGMGKSAQIEAFAEQAGLLCETLSPGERGHGGFGAVPVPIQRGSTTVLSYPMPEWALPFVEKEAAAGVVFLDEINTADSTLQPALLGLAHARRIGGGVLPVSTRIVAAQNNIAEGAGANELGAALLNRFCYLQIDPAPLSAWEAYLTTDSSESVYMDRKALEAEVLKAWPAAKQKATDLVLGFLKKKPTATSSVPKRGEPFASYRAWSG